MGQVRLLVFEIHPTGVFFWSIAWLILPLLGSYVVPILSNDSRAIVFEFSTADSRPLVLVFKFFVRHKLISHLWLLKIIALACGNLF